ncbi:hypothetical protein [Brevibacillus sp. NSP2.1]|uniref:hypothetical protein n=1 Tax=Brevibacillus sp. NSP2.1 TaxID=3003229 RepID=UPI00256F4EB9|nr:hypothetical protein [Brevibacillus sp. NSP2.1]
MRALAIVQNRLLELLRDDLSNHVANALINVDGQLKTYPIFKTSISGMKVTKYIYLDDVQSQGQIQAASLVDSSGNALAVKPLSITKGDSGLLIAFEFEVKVEVSTT